MQRAKDVVLLKRVRMPDFTFNGKVYYNPVEFAMDQIGGTWKMPILWRLNGRTMRYSELRDDIPHISDKMLTSQLKELREFGFVHTFAKTRWLPCL